MLFLDELFVDSYLEHCSEWVQHKLRILLAVVIRVFFAKYIPQTATCGKLHLVICTFTFINLVRKHGHVRRHTKATSQTIYI